VGNVASRGTQGASAKATDLNHLERCAKEGDSPVRTTGREQQRHNGAHRGIPKERVGLLESAA